VEAPSTPSGRPTLTPAVLLAVVFTTVCALASVAFVAARGGLDLPVARPSAAALAIASTVPTAPPSVVPTVVTTPSAATEPAPTPIPTLEPTPIPSPTPGTGPQPAPNPMTLLRRCPDYPACWEYTVRRGDSFSAVADHWRISIELLAWLNPQVTDPRTIVIGEVLYLGLDGYARLHLCPDQSGCYLYVVRPGDRLSTIAGHLGITTAAIVAFDPKISDPNAIFSGETIRVPGPVL
jgi:LysM domain